MISAFILSLPAYDPKNLRSRSRRSPLCIEHISNSEKVKQVVYSYYKLEKGITFPITRPSYTMRIDQSMDEPGGY